MVKLFVEGGGDNKRTLTQCQQGFASLVGKVAEMKPRIVACGSRNNALKAFKAELERGEIALLLVDSEARVEPRNSGRPWSHLTERDNWRKPEGASDDQAHLMVQCMESWFVADPTALAERFGPGFKAAKLPRNPEVEEVAKSDVMAGLGAATKETREGGYHKTRDGFALIGIIDPFRVEKRAPHAKRFFDALRQELGARHENKERRNP